MFATPSERKNLPVPLLSWLEQAEVSGARALARNLLQATADAQSIVQQYFTTPQGAPWHVEGPVVSDHIERILFALFACQERSLFEVEEFAREKDIALEVAALQETLRTHRAFLKAFALVHDSAKPELFSFDAAHHTKGAAEGFAGKRHPTPPELVRYDKLFRAFLVQHPRLKGFEIMRGFFAEYGIEVHYDLHGPRAAGSEYGPLREAVMQLVGLPLSYAKILAETIRYHIDVLHDVDAAKYRLIAARAGKAGLNVDLMLDLTLAHVFLDAVAGSVTSEGAMTDLVIRHIWAEREAFPERHAAREMAKHREAKQELRNLLASVGLEGEQVFALLGTPIGPERGEVMRRVQDALHDPTLRLDFGAETAEMHRRIEAARARLSQVREA